MDDADPYVGEPLLFTMKFVDELTGQPADPTSINLRYTTPGGVTTGIPFGSLSNPAVGTWTYVLATTGFAAGLYLTQLSCSGALVAVSPPQTFTLDPPAVPGL
jgi:hypothetical protein